MRSCHSIFSLTILKKRTLSIPTLGPSGSQGLHHRTLSRSTHKALVRHSCSVHIRPHHGKTHPRRRYQLES